MAVSEEVVQGEFWMTTSQKKGFNDFFLSPFITYMAQENILMIAKGKYNNPMDILVHLYQFSSFPFSYQETSTPAYGCRISALL